MSERKVVQIIRAMETSDGAGVRLKRSLGQGQRVRHDPFLMLDEFGSDEAADYIAGFPPHPHRGFETVTYMLDGHMRHEDHLGNVGELTAGGVQWMTAAGGIIHSEMPQQEEGLMRGFQLWVNLPAREKMKAPSYRDIPAADIPQRTLADGATVKVIAGAAQLGGEMIAGAVSGITTDPLYLDVLLQPGATFRHPVTEGHNAFVYAYEGALRIAGDAVPNSHAALLGGGDEVSVEAGPDGARFLLIAGKPLGEPVVQYGPFVMNTREEIEQAVRDYQAGTLAQQAERR